MDLSVQISHRSLPESINKLSLFCIISRNDKELVLYPLLFLITIEVLAL